MATTVAHEMGHNFGMEHDTKDCECKDDRCIMSPSSRLVAPRERELLRRGGQVGGGMGGEESDRGDRVRGQGSREDATGAGSV